MADLGSKPLSQWTVEEFQEWMQGLIEAKLHKSITPAVLEKIQTEGISGKILAVWEQKNELVQKFQEELGVNSIGAELLEDALHTQFAAAKKRRFQEEAPFVFSKKKSKWDLHWSEIDPDVLVSNGIAFFGVKTYIPSIQLWLHAIQSRRDSNQMKKLLLIDGMVKSGKTTLGRDILPFLLTETPEFPHASFCFVYLDLTDLGGAKTLMDKWRILFDLFKAQFQDAWIGEFQPADLTSYLSVRDALRNLKEFQDGFWFITLDEYHMLFSNLPADQAEMMAENIKHVVLDNESPCHFALAGSTAATFWWSVEHSRPNGLNMKSGAVVLSTPFASSDDDLKKCCKFLHQKFGLSPAISTQIIDGLDPCTVVFVTQVSIIMADTQCTVDEAIAKFVSKKVEVYWRDYHALPGPTTANKFFNWMQGAKEQPPNGLEHHMEKCGDLYFFRDQYFMAWFGAYYNPEKKEITHLKGGVNWDALLFFAPLLPLS